MIHSMYAVLSRSLLSTVRPVRLPRVSGSGGCHGAVLQAQGLGCIPEDHHDCGCKLATSWLLTGEEALPSSMLFKPLAPPSGAAETAGIPGLAKVAQLAGLEGWLTGPAIASLPGQASRCHVLPSGHRRPCLPAGG